VDFERIDAVLVHALRRRQRVSCCLRSILPVDGKEVGDTYVRWAENGAVPVRHEEIVAFVETVGTCLCMSAISIDFVPCV